MDITKFWQWVCNLFKETEHFWSWFSEDISNIPFIGDVIDTIGNIFGIETLSPLWLITFGVGILVIVKFALLFK